MKKILNTLFLIHISIGWIYAQEIQIQEVQEVVITENDSIDIYNAFHVIRSEIDSLDYYNALQKLKNRKNFYAKDSYYEKIYYQAMSTVCGFNQLHEDAIFNLNKSFAGNYQNHSTPDFPEDISGYVLKNAEEYIIQQVSKESIVIFNSFPNISEHALFLKSLLPALYKAGFRYLALEGLNEYYSNEWNQFNTSINVNFLPNINAKWGYYCREAGYAELIREALKTGFQLWSYKSLLAEKNKSENELMAENLNNLIQSYGKEKTRVIVLSAYSQPAKSDANSLYNHFRKISGITPFTINQTEYYLPQAKVYENRELIKRFGKMNISQPSVLLNPTGRSLHEENDDVFIFHPQFSSSDISYPFLLENGKHKKITISNIKQPTIIKAYYANELGKGGKKNSTISIPVDLINIGFPDKKQKYYLFLPQGIFLIQHQDLKGNVIKEYYKKVEL